MITICTVHSVQSWTKVIHFISHSGTN